MITSIQNAEHYSWGDACDGWHLLKNDQLSVIQERMPPGASEQLHLHEKSRQLFFILSGTAQMEVDGEVYTFGAQESLSVAPGAKHRIKNVGLGDLHFLVVSAPKSHGDRVNLQG